MTSPRATLTFHQLRSGYEADKTSALTDALLQGQHLVIKGASGSGKTSLLRVMCALQPAQHGHIAYQKQTVSVQNLPWWRRQFCYLPQEPVMGANTIADVLRLPWSLQATDNLLPSDEECQTTLACLNLQHDMNQDVDTLSGGQKQRLAIARALLLDRPVWLMDEPTSALDAKNRDSLMTLLKTLPIITVSISHDPEWMNAASHTFVLGDHHE
ncbi:ABC transporter [Enterovibrio norvegicus FF-33]|uniref:ABC transporter ATP-binding protein n=1 Tax=Enterovibrio TaxID=188143 RepID=UPI00031C64CD|nr:ATP-binding cassette domain-containing protein [Enterovibrio norvegicus]OEE66416.1 ABC transporter [Enterovibrio norvegicus FF-33]OEE85330.1 ABC transporter [Enterovibrio norvegicus FF-162]